MIRALVGDDEENIRKGLIRQIESLDLGIQVVAAAENGRQVMEYYEKMTPDLLVLDINMPLMSGLECIEQIRAQDPDCVILILSGYDHFSYAQKAIQHHVDFYLLKPVEDEELEGRAASVRGALSAADGTTQADPPGKGGRAGAGVPDPLFI